MFPLNEDAIPYLAQDWQPYNSLGPAKGKHAKIPNSDVLASNDDKMVHTPENTFLFLLQLIPNIQTV